MAEPFRPLAEVSRTDAASIGLFFGMLGEVAKVKKAADVPVGFVIPKEYYEQFIEHNNLRVVLKTLLARVELYDHRSLEKTSAAIQKSILKGVWPEKIKEQLQQAFIKLPSKTVVVRAGVVAGEDLEVAPFRQIHFKVTSAAALVSVLKRSLADHFSEATLIAVLSKGYDYRSLPLAWLVQTEIVGVLSGEVVRDTATTMTIRVRTGYTGGEYRETAVVSVPGVQKKVSAVIRRESAGAWLISEKELVTIATTALAHEGQANHFRLTFVFDKDRGCRVTGFEPITPKAAPSARTYVLQKKGTVLASGHAVGEGIGQGRLVFATTIEKALASLPGSVLVVGETDARFESVLARASAVIVESARLESHVVRFCREQSIPCLVGVKKIKQLGKEGEVVTVSCADGLVGAVYKSALPFVAEPIPEGATMKTRLTVSLTDSAQAETQARLPFAGVGLLSEETVYAKYIGIHPLTFSTTRFLPKSVKEAVQAFAGHEKPADKVVRRMAEEIARVAVAFTGREVAFRLSAADTTEYASLIGGTLFEKTEKNPRLGWRGVSRFIDPKFSDAFALTCQAVKRVRDDWGLTNVTLLIPFCRTLDEGQQILALLKQNGLERGKNGLTIQVMCEIPSNAILAKEFIRLFDGFSIGLNQLAELTLGLDRTVFSDHAYREEDKAIKSLIAEVIGVAHRSGKRVSMCDATPSEYPHFVSFLVQEGIDSIAVTADRARVVEAEIVRVERKVAKAPLGLSLNVFTRSVSMASFAGISMLLAGYTCQPVNLDETKQNLKLTMEKQVAEIQTASEQRVADLRAADEAAKVDRYHERGFADFTVTYPAKWSFVTRADGVVFRAPSGTAGYFDIFREPRKAMKEYTFTATSTWLGNDVGLFVDGANKGMIIFPNDKAFKETVVVQGNTEHFDTILATITSFAWVPKLK